MLTTGSVCGEPCHLQTCLRCSPQDRLQNVADFIMQRALHELRPELGVLDELIITLPDCRHAFTVETLDGHCELTDYYEQDAEGHWRGLKMPPLGYKKPPTCPTCRAAITSPRYGRVFKRADLDILEINVANEMSRTLHGANDSISSFDRAGTRRHLREAANSLKPDPVKVSNKAMKKRLVQRDNLLDANGNIDQPMGLGALDPGSPKYFGLSKQEASAWREATGPLQRSYEQALKVASARSAHTRAWEAAFASLYDQEIQASLQNLSRAPRIPEEHAMRVAQMKVGQSRPLADRRFLVEATWLTIEIRHLLAELATVWLDPSLMTANYQSTHGRIWADYILFILKSSARDAQIALRIAEQSGSQRQMIRSRILIFNCELETFKFTYRMAKDTDMSSDERHELANQAKEKRAEVRNAIKAETSRNRWAGELALPENEHNELFGNPARMIVGEWEELETALRTGVSYNPVSYEEKRQIISALMGSYQISEISLSSLFYSD